MLNMDDQIKGKKTLRLAVYLSLLLVAGFYFSITVEIFNSPVRIGLSDVFLPFALILIIFDVWKSKNIPVLNIKYGWMLIIAISIWLSASFAIGFYNSGVIHQWALFNKLIGWFVLVTYLFCGAWICNNCIIRKESFLKIFICIAFFIALYSLMYHWQVTNNQLWYLFHEYQKFIMHQYVPSSGDIYRGLEEQYIYYYSNRVEGFSYNPNAFGLIMACVFVLHISFVDRNELFKKKSYYLISTIILLAIYYSSSRSTWVGLALGVAVIVLMNKKILKPVFFSIVLCFLCNIIIFNHNVLFTFNTSNLAKHFDRALIENIEVSDVKRSSGFAQDSPTKPRRKTINNIYILNDLKPNSSACSEGLAESIKTAIYESTWYRRLTNSNSLKPRIETYMLALKYWTEDPIIGVGLGVFSWRSQLEGGNPSGDVLHNTALWLLAETGIIGLVLFSLFFLACIRSLISESKNKSSLSISILGLIFVMLGASIGTEILYQRYLWFFIGLALAYKQKDMVKRT